MVLPFYSVLSYHISLQDINMNVAHVRAIGVSRMYEIINGLCLQADVETLKKYCGPEVIERCKAEHKAYQSNGIFFDNKVRNFTFPKSIALFLSFSSSFMHKTKVYDCFCPNWVTLCYNMKKYKRNGDESSLHSFHSSIYMTLEEMIEISNREKTLEKL